MKFFKDLELERKNNTVDDIEGARAANEEAVSELDSLAAKELNRVIERIPVDAAQRFVLYTEALRQIDYWSVFQRLQPKEARLKPWDLEILWLGWNRASEVLFSKLSHIRGFPIVKATQERSRLAAALLHQLGRSVLMRRTADMVRYRHAKAIKVGGGWEIRKGVDAIDQLLDVMELSRWAKMVDSLGRLDDGEKFNGWALFERDDVASVAERVGRFLGRSRSDPLAAWRQDEVNELMKPLIHPWDSGYGIMAGYGAIPEVDCHFFAVAAALVMDWRDDAGFHPKITISGVRMQDLYLAVTAMTSLHLKHTRFTLLASQMYPEISIPESLTIWTHRDELEETICALTGLGQPVVSKLVTVIALRADDIPRLSGSTTPLMPLLIDLGNGLMLRPVSSISRNPFESIRTLLQCREPQTRNRIATPREEWLRSHIYASFQGTRYSCVEGNVKVRREGVVLTDIDAAVLDRTTGELALFQIKWQDFATNDVRQLRSKTRNLSQEMDDWAERISDWIKQLSPEQLAKSLRLKLGSYESISSIYMFGVSWALARTRGYGFVAKHPGLAIASWPHFSRLRIQIGPSSTVIGDLHRTLRAQMSEAMVAIPLPFSVKVAGVTCRFEDIWNAYDDEGGIDAMSEETQKN